MTLPMLSRKRILCNRYDEEPPLYTKKCLSGLKTVLERYQSDTATEHFSLQTVSSIPCFIGESKHLPDTWSFFERISSWADTQSSVKKVLEHLKSKQSTHDVSLNNWVNKKFLEFHRDMTEECGVENKQHSWAVIEKEEEIFMYGPYYPNYSNGLHSEDIIIKQTERLLEAEDVSENWKVYVFTLNSPCLARNTEPCMLKLVQKAQEWWSVYGVKTHIGFVKFWGFKGAKENMFRDINSSQMDLINQTVDYESYLKAAEKKTNLNPLCENVFSAVKYLLKSEIFHFINTLQEQEWRSCFRGMHSIYEHKPEEEKEIFTQEVNSVIEAAQTLLSETNGSFIEHLDKGRTFASGYNFSSQISDAIQDQIRCTFQECWREIIQEKYAEFIKEKLTEDMNHCTVQLFIKDVEKSSREFLQIGQIQSQVRTQIHKNHTEFKTQNSSQKCFHC